MRQFKYILLPLFVTLWITTVYAGDEDMSPSAYHVFDPETGYMMTVDPLDEEQQQPAATDDVPPLVEPAAPDPWRYWIATIVIVGGIAVWLHKRRDSK